jgi:hypothetical protein
MTTHLASARMFKMGDHLFESFSDHLPLLRGRQLPRSSNHLV